MGICGGKDSARPAAPCVAPHTLPMMMKAVRYAENTDDVAQFTIGSIPLPTVAKGEVLVKVSAASVNPIDYKVMSGALKGVGWAMPLPFTMGYDLAGAVVLS
eukprot:gene24762-39942_t